MKSKKAIMLSVLVSCLYSPKKLVNLIKSNCLPKKAKVAFSPVFADIESTISCNLNCVMCHRKELAVGRNRLSLTFGQFREVIDKLPYLLKLNLQGMGEPLLSGELFEMINYAKKRHIYVSTVTNGMLMNEEKAKKTLESGLDRIYFSIDSSDAEKYVAYRVNGRLEQVVENLKKLVEIRDKKKSKLHIGVWMLLFNNNLDQLIPMIKLAKTMGVDELIVQSHVSYRGKRDWKEVIGKLKLKDENEKVGAEILRAERFAKKIKLNFSIQSGMGALKPDAKSLCQWPWKSIYVASNGDISSCCIVADPKLAYLGNILSQDFSQIWNGEAYRNLRTALIESKIPGYCRECYGK
ncbi:MAG: radical SAM protein [Candidatus Moraniibacteriota bacterium]